MGAGAFPISVLLKRKEKGRERLEEKKRREKGAYLTFLPGKGKDSYSNWKKKGGGRPNE